MDRPITRRLGLADAVVIGLGSMIGAGVFAAFAPAAAAAGTGLLAGLVLAGLVAFCNATSSAQLAAQYPVSGGTYVYGREVLGPWPGFFAGWAFIVGKTASSAAMALTFAGYAVPEPWVKPVAVAAVAALTFVNTRGVTRTAAVTRGLVAVTLVALAVVVAIGAGAAHQPIPGDAVWEPLGVLQAAGFLFFAFAGYARIATMGEEVRRPERTIPRAITLALALVLAVYAVVGWVALRVLGPERLAGSVAPLADVAAVAGAGWAVPLVRVGAATAALGALLALVAGVGRTALAMARAGDLPTWFAAVHPRFEVPHRAELTLGLLVCGLVLVTDLRGAIGFSSFGVLLYYFIANLAAWRQDPDRRRYPRVLPVVGALGCLALAAALPVASVVGGLLVLAAGLLYRLVRLRVRR